MNRKRVILAGLLVAVVCLGGLFLRMPSRTLPSPLAVSFIGFEEATALPLYQRAPIQSTNLAPPTLAFPRRFGAGPSYEAVFQLTNPTATRIRYQLKADGSANGNNSKSSHGQSGELPAYGSRRFALRTPRSTNGWQFQVTLASSQPRPAWQLSVTKFCKRIGAPAIFAGPATAYPASTNTWKVP